MLLFGCFICFCDVVGNFCFGEFKILLVFEFDEVVVKGILEVIVFEGSSFFNVILIFEVVKV